MTQLTQCRCIIGRTCNHFKLEDAVAYMTRERGAVIHCVTMLIKDTKLCFHLLIHLYELRIFDPDPVCISFRLFL